MSAEIGEFKGKPTITLGAETKYPFSFGAAKARMILDHIEDIRAFVGTAPAPKSGHRAGMAVIGGQVVAPRNGRCEDAPCCGCCPP